MAFSTEQFYGESRSTNKVQSSFVTPPHSWYKSKKCRYTSKSADFRRKLSFKHSRISYDDSHVFKAKGNKHKSVDLLPKFELNKSDIRKYIGEQKSFDVINRRVDALSEKSTNEETGVFSNSKNDIEHPILTTTIEKVDDFNHDVFDGSAVSGNVFEDENGLIKEVDLLPVFESISPIKSNFSDTIVNVPLDKNIPPGLNNLGNTCYLNSAVQSLFSLNFFIEDLIQCYNLFKDHSDDMQDLLEKLSITNALIRLYEEYKLNLVNRSNSKTQIAEYLTTLKLCIGQKVTLFDSYEQQDAAELITSILESLKQELTINTKLCHRNPVSRFFEYSLVHETSCRSCKANNISSEKSNTFHLQLTQDRTIQSAFLNYFESNTDKCLKCSSSESQSLISKKYFEELPKILFFQVVRYSDVSMRKKDTNDIFASHCIYLPKKFIKLQHLLSPISTPYRKSLDMSCELIMKEKNSFVKCLNFNETPSTTEDDAPEFDNPYQIEEIKENGCDNKENSNKEKSETHEMVTVPNDTLPSTTHPFIESECEKFHLMSIICHHGSILSCGHYTSYVYNFKFSKWFSCDDMNVTEVPFSEVEQTAQSTGYCYFYVHSPT